MATKGVTSKSTRGVSFASTLSKVERRLFQAVTEEAEDLLLNLYSGAAAAYSLRKLDKDYSGSAIRVRRDSDNEEQDIGFDGNDLDTSSLESFADGGDVFVTTWYDQSGEGNDADQSSASEQPKIVSGGSTITENGKPAVDFDGSDDYLTAGTGYDTDDGYSVFVASSPNIDIDSKARYSIFGLGSSSSDRFMSLYGGFDTDTRFLSLLNTGEDDEKFVYTQDINANQQTLTSTISKQSGTELFFNGDGQGIEDTSNSPTDITSSAELRLGQRYANDFTDTLDGKIQEYILYKTDQSSNRSDIESNINDYYNIF